MNLKLRPIDLAREVDVSTQTVRDYERYGFLPPAPRSLTGYRWYDSLHLQAMRAARVMIGGYGWEAALQIMQRLHKEDSDGALRQIHACHAALYQRRQEAETILKSLISLSTIMEKQRHQTEEQEQDPVRPVSRRPLRISEAARAIGVRPSTIRYWEQQGLVRPPRVSRSTYRSYSQEHLLTLRIIALLRQANHDVDTIRDLLKQMEGANYAHVIAAADQRIEELMLNSRQCAAATSAAWDYLERLEATGHIIGR